MNKFVQLSMIAMVVLARISCSSTIDPLVTKIAISPKEANALLLQSFSVPQDIISVDVQTSSMYSAVEMDISEKQFREWCLSKKWPIRKIMETKYVRGVRDSSGRMVAAGLEFNIKTGDHGFSGVFDSGESRAFVSYTGR